MHDIEYTPPNVASIIFGLVGVGCQRHFERCRSLLELDSQGAALFCFWGSVTAGCRVRSFVPGEEPLLRTSRNDRINVVFMAMHPRGSYIVLPLLSLEVATPKNTLTH